MDAKVSLLNSPDFHKLKVWVLAPIVISDNSNIDYYYDFSQSITEYTKVFSELGLNWVWKQVTLSDFKSVIDEIEKEKIQGTVIPVVLNICDGDEVNGAPGVSVIKYLKEKDIIFTGADEYFFEITTSKIPMKQAFDKAGVPTPSWAVVQENFTKGEDLIRTMGSPLILKPAVSGGSMGVVKNVVDTAAQVDEMVSLLQKGYRGWNLTADGIIAEEFIAGPEFTTFIIGSYFNASDAVIYNPVERVFHPSLPEKEKFLSFDRLWEIYEEEAPMPANGNFYEYRPASKELVDSIKKISWDAYSATGGTGYTRVDLRMDAKTGKIYVLEVNAQCGLSEDENYTSIGAILNFNQQGFSQAILQILNDGWLRHRQNKNKNEQVSLQLH
jgi:D-alanine-D-alanine ligase